jgi:Sec-independent protein translocase protein TatA
MEFLGVGPMELIFILILALIILGPRDMVKTGRTAGRFLRQIVTSPMWRSIQQTSKEMRVLPTKLMREAGLEDEARSFSQGLKDLDPRSIGGDMAKNMIYPEGLPPTIHEPDLSSWTTPVNPPGPVPGAVPFSTDKPPAAPAPAAPSPAASPPAASPPAGDSTPEA